MAVQIAVASGKGGTGKTTVSAQLFRLLNQEKLGQALLADCDVEEPNDLLFFPDAKLDRSFQVKQEIPFIDTSRCTFCRKCSDYCEFNAIVVIPPAGFAEVNSGLCHSCGACSVACQDDAIRVEDQSVGMITEYRDKSGNRLIEGRLNIGSAMQTLVIRTVKRQVKEVEQIVILDAPPGSSCPVVETIAGSDFVLLVSEPTPFGLHDLKILVELTREMGLPFGVIVNKAGLGDRAIYDYLEQEKIELIGEIPFSKSYAAHYAIADLFNQTPPEIEAAHRDIYVKLQNKGLLR